jgi:O-antigen/teichoic acid export membrane protein
MKDLKEKVIRGGMARLVAQGANFCLRLASLMILARLLVPKDFGLVGMVTAFTGVLGLFRDFGLSAAAIQRAAVTEEQASTLFWINLVVGVFLGLLAVGLAPAVAAFYHEPRLIGVTAALAAGFVFNAAGIQHGVILQREMRFTALAVVNTVALIVSSVVGVVGAVAGYGYWSLVAMTVSLPFTLTIGLWIATGWVPGRPRRQSGIRSMLRFGGTLTLYGLICYIANNFDKVLLGRVWGVEALGLYGRAYSLINIPTDNLNSAVGEVAFAALSRLQDDPHRLRSYFLKGYSLMLAVTLPITIACALFADDVVFVVLGPKWTSAVPIFRLLAPTILMFAIVNPLSWFMGSLGMVARGLKMAVVIAPIMVIGYVIGLPYGPQGVASAYSIVMVLWAVPAIVWAVHGTVVSTKDVLMTAIRPLAAGIAAGMFALGIGLACGRLHPLARLTVETTVLLFTYGVTLLFAGQKSQYLDLIRGLTRPLSAEQKALTSTYSG